MAHSASIQIRVEYTFAAYIRSNYRYHHCIISVDWCLNILFRQHTWIVSLWWGQIEYTGASCPSNEYIFCPCISQTYKKERKLQKTGPGENEIDDNHLQHVKYPYQLVISASDNTKLLIWPGECYVINSTRMSLNLTWWINELVTKVI